MIIIVTHKGEGGSPLSSTVPKATSSRWPSIFGRAALATRGGDCDRLPELPLPSSPDHPRHPAATRFGNPRKPPRLRIVRLALSNRADNLISRTSPLAHILGGVMEGTPGVLAVLSSSAT